MVKFFSILILNLYCVSLFADFVLPPGKRPIELKILVYISDVHAIETSTQSFEARVFYEVSWHDKRLAHEGKVAVVKNLSEIWNPNIQIINQQKVWKSFSDVVKIKPDGEVTYLQGIWGVFAQPMKLEKFPFDRQKFSLHFLSIGDYSTSDVSFVADNSGVSGIGNNLSIADWKILNWEENVEPLVLNDLSKIPGIKFSFEAKRLELYYVVKMILPLVMIVMMSWAVFWMDPLNVGSNVGISITSMLTLIAYRFSADTILPRLSYLTSLDYFILASTILVFLSLIQNLTTSSLTKLGKTKQSYKLDLYCRVIFPLIFVAIIIETMFLRWLL